MQPPAGPIDGHVRENDPTRVSHLCLLSGYEVGGMEGGGNAHIWGT